MTNHRSFFLGFFHVWNFLSWFQFYLFPPAYYRWAIQTGQFLLVAKRVTRFVLKKNFTQNEWNDLDWLWTAEIIIIKVILPSGIKHTGAGAVARWWNGAKEPGVVIGARSTLKTWGLWPAGPAHDRPTGGVPWLTARSSSKAAPIKINYKIPNFKLNSLK
jgi:hypothetical protein